MSNMQRLVEVLLIIFYSSFVQPDCSGSSSVHNYVELQKYTIICSNVTLIDIKQTFTKEARCPNLISFKVQDSEIEHIDVKSFGTASEFSCLKTFYFENCHLQSVALDTFSNLPNIADMSFRNNEIHDINFLRNLPNLETLYLSVNQIEEIQEDVLKALSKLRYLDLSYNFLRKLPNMGAENLENLVLSVNSIEVLENNTFDSLSKLQTLYLDDNNISSVEADAFVGLTELILLSLSNNSIAKLQGNIFKDLQSLRELDLRYNKISSIDSKTFFGLRRLKTLFLGHNSIETSPMLGIFNDLVSLQVLKLDHNQIRFIAIGTFSYLHELQIVDLSHNKISRLNDYTLFPLRNLEYLYLNDNKLNYLGKSFGKHVYKNLRRVDIGTNDWVCENLFDLLVTLRNDNINYLPETPKFLQNNIDGIGCR